MISIREMKSGMRSPAMLKHIPVSSAWITVLTEMILAFVVGK
jgi:hypothetical protein